jgi:RNA polymerase sigma-70 factor (ECF subfamily)
VTQNPQRSDPDLDLVRACRNVNDEDFEAAFEDLYLRYRDRVYSIAYRMTGRASDAMDVVQDSFAMVFRKLSTFRFDSLFSTWLFRLVVNCSIDYRRRERTRSKPFAPAVVSLCVNDEPSDPTSNPVADAESSEFDRHIHSTLQRLSPKLRAVLVLRYLEGQSYEELAATLELSLGTVKSRLARAHVAMEQVLRGTLAAHGMTEHDNGVAGPEEGIA